MLSLVIIFTICVAFAAYNFLKILLFISRCNRLTSNIPCPPTWPIIGNAHLFFTLKTTKDMFEKAYSLVVQYTTESKIVKLWLGPKLFILIGDPELIKTFLSRSDVNDKGSSYDYMKLGCDGILVCNGKKWQDLRNPLNKYLSKKMVETYLDAFNEKSAQYCKILEKFAENGETIDIHCLTCNWSFDNLMKANFKKDLNELEKERYNVPELTRKLIDLVLTMMMFPPHCLSLTIAKHSKLGRELQCCIEKVYDLVNEKYDERKEEVEKLGENLNTFTPTCYGEFLLKKAFLEKLTNEERAKLTIDIMVAGYDTVASIVNNAILMLAIFPEYQEGVYKEIVDVLGENLGNFPTFEQLNHMHLLDRILKETLRLYSPPFVQRKANNDIVIGDYTIPEGSNIALNFRFLHSDPKIWSHPDQFYPDHFLPENIANRPKGVFYPFSWGQRGCPGDLFAMIEMKCLLVQVIRKYKLETDLKFEELELSLGLAVEILNGHFIRFKLRIKNIVLNN